MKKKALFVILIVIFACWNVHIFADEAQKADQNKPEFKPEFPKETVSETKHSVTINGTVINYTARAGTIVLKEENGRPKASFFFVAYTKDGITDPGTRPIMFSFNGGPG